MSTTLAFVLNGAPVVVDADVERGESLLNVLRERLGVMSAKDGCAPQGQCGCCTVLVDGEPRVACVTPIARVEDRAVTTIEGLGVAERANAAQAFVATGGSQCGFCTPGIIMRFAGTRTRDVNRALAAHLCRCTGWLTVRDAIANETSDTERDLDAASSRAALEAGGPQHVDLDAPLGGAAFADDTAPRDALVAVPRPPGSTRGGGRSCGYAMGRRRVAAGGAGPGGQGAGPAHDGRRARAPARPDAAVPDRRRAARDAMGRARVPGARRVVVRAGRRTGVAARERGRVRRQGALGRTRGGACSSPITSGARCESSTRAKTSCGSGRNARRSRPSRSRATASSRSTVSSCAAQAFRRSGRLRTASRYGRAGRRSTCQVRR